MPKAAALLLAALGFVDSLSFGAVLTVGPDGAHATIQAAIDAALVLGGDNQIRVQRDQTYQENLTISAAFSNGSIEISGGWNSAFDARQENPALTVIDGGAAGRVFEIRASGAAVLIQGFTIRNGLTDFPPAGILVNPTNDSEITIQQNRIQDNVVDTATHTAQGAGLGGYFTNSTELILSQNLFAGNRATSESRPAGGAGLALAFDEDGRFSILDNLILDNLAATNSNQVNGAGVILQVSGQSSGDFSRNQILNNVAGGENSPTLANAMLVSAYDSSRMTGSANRIAGNRDDRGGASGQVHLATTDSASLRLTDTLVSDGNAGGISAEARDPGSSIDLTNLTIAGNVGYGLLFYGQGTKILANSLLFGNGQASDFQGEVLQSANQIGIDPFFVDPQAGDYHLLAGSPAIDGGDAMPPEPLSQSDLDGDPRISGQTVDIGAYEFSGSESVLFFPQVGNGSEGEIAFTTSTRFANTGSIPAGVTMDFFDSNGNPASFEFGADSADGRLSFLLSPGESFSGQTSGQGTLSAGYARIRTAPGVGGIAIFARADAPSQTVLYRAGVQTSDLLQEFTIFVDTLGDRDTGLALVHPGVPEIGPAGAADANLTLRLRDPHSQLIGTVELALASGQHLARFVSQLFADFPESEEMEGILTVESDRPIAVTTLLQEDDPSRVFPAEVPTLTTLPIVRPPVAGGLFYFPQFGNGQFGNLGFATSARLLNTAESAATATIDFFDATGNPVSFDFASINPAGSSQMIDLQPGESFSGQTPGVGDLQSGYARVTAGAGVEGIAIFTRSDVPSGNVLYRAGIPASQLLSDFTVFVDTLGQRDTGVAIVNPADSVVATGNADAQLTLRLYDQEFQLIEAAMLVLPAGQQIARFVSQLFETEMASEMEGTLTVSSDRPIVVVALLQEDDPATDFPHDVPTLTTLPILPEVAEMSSSPPFSRIAETPPPGGQEAPIDIKRCRSKKCEITWGIRRDDPDN